MTITMDGTVYRLFVRFDTMSRSFRLADGDNAGDMLSGYHKRDLIGTFYDYAMDVEPDPAAPEDYDAFFEAISAPVDSHSLILPYGQGTITFDAMITSGDDMYRGRIARRNRWGGLKVRFTAQRPQREPET